MIPQAKIVALREALERDGIVTFKNGSTIEWSASQTGPEGEQAEGRLVVKRGHGGETRYTEDEIRRAYEMALNGPRPKQQPPAPERDFGEVPF